MYPPKSSNLLNLREGHQKCREHQQEGAFSAGGPYRQRYANAVKSFELADTNRCFGVYPF